jgi:hypothetical protein
MGGVKELESVVFMYEDGSGGLKLGILAVAGCESDLK